MPKKQRGGATHAPAIIDNLGSFIAFFKDPDTKYAAGVFRSDNNVVITTTTVLQVNNALNNIINNTELDTIKAKGDEFQAAVNKFLDGALKFTTDPPSLTVTYLKKIPKEDAIMYIKTYTF
jgi:hypothetical protein